MAKTPDTETKRIHLTSARVRRLQSAAGKTQYIFDDDPKQLCVRVAAAGAKSYVFRGKMSGSSLRITIGSTDSTSLDDARAEARRLKNLIEKGIDPRELAREKAESKASAAKSAEKRRTHTLSALCAAYADHLKAKGKQKSYRDVKSLFKVHVVDAWPDYAVTPANEITSHQIAAIIRKVREAGKGRTAGMLRNCITAAYNAARRAPFDSSMPSSMIEFEVSTNPAEVVPTIPVNRGSRVLSVLELKAYMAGLGDDAAGQALRVALYSGGQRAAQLLRATPGDFDADTGTLRLWDTKGKRSLPREHLIPLGPKAVKIVCALSAGKQDNDSLFGVQSQTIGNRVSELSAKCSAPFDLRDIRRTVETQLAGMGIHKDTRAQLLSHGISGVQAAHYDRHEYFNEKRSALIAWERRLEEIENGESGSNVVQMR